MKNFKDVTFWHTSQDVIDNRDAICRKIFATTNSDRELYDSFRSINTDMCLRNINNISDLVNKIGIGAIRYCNVELNRNFYDFYKWADKEILIELISMPIFWEEINRIYNLTAAPYLCNYEYLFYRVWNCACRKEIREYLKLLANKFLSEHKEWRIIYKADTKRLFCLDINKWYSIYKIEEKCKDYYEYDKEMCLLEKSIRNDFLKYMELKTQK